MATASIQGTITLPIAEGGPSVSMILGTPSITPSSTTTGPQLTFTEKSSNTYRIPTGAPVSIPFGTVSDADVLYLGTNQPISVVLNGGADTFTLPVGGMILMYGASITALQVEATLLEATVEVLIIGD